MFVEINLEKILLVSILWKDKVLKNLAIKEDEKGEDISNKIMMRREINTALPSARRMRLIYSSNQITGNDSKIFKTLHIAAMSSGWQTTKL